MEFKDKLLELRKSKGLTQEELAKNLFITRTAISKWESGRGYPSLASLEEIAKYFSVTIDELINTNEVIKAAESEKKSYTNRTFSLITNVIDILLVVFLIAPIFRNGNDSPVNTSLLNIVGIDLWIKISFIAIICLSIFNGACGFIVSFFDKPIWNKHRFYTGLGLSIIGLVIFIISKQPYVAIFYLFLLLIKVFFLIVRKMK